MKGGYMKRVLSVIIVLCLLATATINILATDNNNDASNGYNDYKTIEKKDYELEIAEKKKSSDEFEVVSLREECVKHFAQKDGTIKAIVYPFPVHILSEDDKWEDLYDYDRSVPLTAERFESLRDGNNYSVNGYENYDTYISQSYPSTNFFGSSEKIVGTNEITYYYCANPDIPDNATVVSSSVSYNYRFQSGITSGIIFIEVYEVVAAWDPFDITYNNSGTNNGLATTPTDLQYMIASSSITSNSPGLCSFDVTELTKDWYAGKQNNGIGFKRMTGSISQIYFCSNSHHWPVYSVTYTLDELEIGNGCYFIENEYTDLFLSIDKSVSNINQDQISIKADSLVLDSIIYDSEIQQWNVRYLNNGYYKITSRISHKSLAIPAGNENANNSQIVQESYSGLDRQQWSLSVSNSGFIVMRPKSSESYPTSDWAIAVKTNENGIPKSVVQNVYVNNSNMNDEWTFNKTTDTGAPLRPQEMSNWCWVASAEMFAKNYYRVLHYSQSDVVEYVKGDIVDVAGNNIDITSAIYKFSSSYSPSVIAFGGEYIYSCSMLMEFIDDGHVLAITIGEYNQLNSSRNPLNSHEVLVYGYVTINDTVMVMIRNPAPEDVGRTQLIAYDDLVFSTSIFGNTTHYFVWTHSISCATSYYLNWSPNYFSPLYNG